MRIIFLLVSYLISTSLSATQIAESENNISPLLNGQQIHFSDIDEVKAQLQRQKASVSSTR